MGQHGRVAMATNLPDTACLITPAQVSTETFATAAPPATVLGRDSPVWDLHKGVGPPPNGFAFFALFTFTFMSTALRSDLKCRIKDL